MSVILDIKQITVRTTQWNYLIINKAASLFEPLKKVTVNRFMEEAAVEKAMEILKERGHWQDIREAWKEQYGSYPDIEDIEAVVDEADDVVGSDPALKGIA